MIGKYPIMLRVWTCNSFKGHWPVGTAVAAVVVAETAKEAAEYLSDTLRAEGLAQTVEPDQLQEVPLVAGYVVVLADGNY